MLSYKILYFSLINQSKMENLLIRVTSIFNNAIRHNLKIHSVVTDKNRIIIYFENGSYLIDFIFKVTPPEIEYTEKNLFKVAYIVTSNLWNIKTIKIVYP